MIPLSSAAKDLVRVREILRHPASFTLAVVKGFRANQGFLLAGAVAYYTLLSLVPALILVVIALHKLVDETLLLSTLGDFLEFAVPGQAQAIVSELTVFLANHEAVGGILLVTMLFFSALAFTVLENAMSVIFYHRVAIRRRRFLVSALMPYVFIVFLAFGLLIVTFVAGRLDALAAHDITVFGQLRDFSNLSAVILYVLGVVGEILLLSGIYLVMPVGRLSWRHALIGGIAAALLWEITRHILTWYFGTISQIQVVYGSLTSAIAVLLSVEMGALVLLIGAQVIAEYERSGREAADQPAGELSTASAARAST